MSAFDPGLSLLRTLRDSFNTPGLGASVDVLERLVAGQADERSLHSVLERLPLMARLAVALRGHPNARAELERVVREIEVKFANMRELQAGRSFAVFGDALGAPNARAYLVGTDKLEGVMEIPAFPEVQMVHFGETLLVDGRVIEKVGLVETCKLAELAYKGNNGTLVPRDPGRTRKGLYWCRFQDGRRNHGRKLSDCRVSYEGFEVGVNAMEAIARYVQDDMVLWKHYMDLTESVDTGNRGLCAVLGVWGGGPELAWYWRDDALPIYGAASRGE